MKKIALIMLVFLITIASAFATFEVSTVSFGSDSQERAQDVSTSVIITNKETSRDITDVSISFNGADKYDIADVTSTGLALIENDTETMTLQGYVPLDLDAVDSKGKKVAINIGTIDVEVTYDDATTETKSVSVSMEAENLLEFNTDSKITFEDGDDSKLKDGKSYDDISRDEKVTIDLVIENKFDNNGDCSDPDDYGDCDIEDIELEFEPDDSDWDDETIDYNDLGAEKEDTESFSFTVPDDIDEDDYDFELWVIGTDENGALHGEWMQFTLEVVVPDDDISITDAYFSPSTVECGINHITLKVMIENTGTDDQSKAAIEIDSPRLDLQDSIYNIDIDEGDSETYTFDISIPEDTEPGTYYVTVETFYNNNDESNLASVSLIVEDCQEDYVDDEDIDWEEDETDTEDNSNTDVNIIEVPPSTGVIVGEEKEPSFFESNAYTLLLVALFLVALLMFFIMLIVLLRK